MMFDYSLAGLVTAGLMIYLVYALLQARAALKGIDDHDRHRLDSNSALLRRRHRARRAARRYMTHVFDGERTFLSPVLRPVEAGALLARRRRREARAALDHLYRRDAVLPCRRISDRLRLDAACRRCCRSTRPTSPRWPRICPSTRRSASHQHQLAELRRREHAELSDADARPDAPELRLGGDRHRAGHGADSRLRARVGARRSAISGSISRAARSISCCRSRSSARSFLVWQGVPQNTRRLCRRDHARRRQADHQPGPGRLADRDQAARHQWRRLLERQLPRFPTRTRRR